MRFINAKKMQEEIWKDIPNYEGLYQASNLGNIKSLQREIHTERRLFKINDRILNPINNSEGYLMVNLYRNGNKNGFKIHQLVAMAFLNHKPCGMHLVVDHINDIKTDNRVCNLQVVTQRFNIYKTQGKYTSKYKGVSWSKEKNKWTAEIRVKGKRMFLGRHGCELKAHLAYQNALKLL